MNTQTSELRVAPRRPAALAFALAVICAMLFFPGSALARPGTLDSSFGRAGVATLQDFDHNAGAIALASDGKIVAAGDGFDYSNAEEDPVHELSVARFKSNGNLDDGFGDGGVSSIPVESFSVRGADVDDQGRAVIVGISSVGPHLRPQVELARLLPDGRLDEDFGESGFAVADPGVPAAPLAVRVVSSGDIVVAAGLRHNFVGARLDASGSPDSSYGNDGFAVFSRPKSYGMEAADIDNGGGMIILGELGGLVRIGSKGQLDKPFTRNRQAASFGKCERCSEEYDEVALGRDGTVIVGGVKGGNRSLDRGPIKIVRYLANGARDHGFSSDGLTTFAKAKHDGVASLEPLASGKLLVVRRTPVDAAGDYPNKGSVVRLTQSGRFDDAFGRKGATGPNKIRSFNFFSAVGSDGSLVVLSTKWYYGGDETDLEPNGFQLFRIRNDGRSANP